MAKSGLKHIDVGPELTKTEWESEDSHELLHGTSFPGSPVERQLFYRDDEHKWYIYNASAWVWLGGGGGGMSVHGNEYHDPDFEQQGVAAGLISTHEAAADPHTGYRLESADHTHQSTGAQAGKLDHGLALNGLSDDDHPQYIKHSLATAISDFLVASGAGVFVKKTLAEVKTLLNWAADIATHSALATGIHGVGASTVASIANIATHAALTATHGVAGTIAGLADIVSYIATHTGLTTGVHGAGSSHLALFGAASTLVSRVVWKDAAELVLNLSAQTTPIDWTDLDLTAYTSANAKLALLQVKFNGEFGTAGDNSFYMRKNGTSEDKLFINIPSSHPDYDSVFMTTMMGLDSGQVMEYKLAIATNAVLYIQIVCMGYIE